MIRIITTAIALIFIASCGSRGGAPEPEQTVFISPAPQEWNAWAYWVNNKYPISDAEGHGPDIGSYEWARALDQRLGVSKDGRGPVLKSSAWRRAVESRLALMETDTDS